MVVYRVFIMIETQLFHLCPDGQLQSNYIARMPPSFLCIDMVCKPVLGIENEKVGILKKLNRGFTGGLEIKTAIAADLGLD